MRAGPAAAFHCFVVKKPIGSGSAATVTFDVTSGGEPDFSSLPFNPNSGRVQGGFVTPPPGAGLGTALQPGLEQRADATVRTSEL